MLNWCFWILVLEKTLDSHLDCKEIKLGSPKGNQPWIFIGRTDAKAEAPILWPPNERAYSLEKTLMLGKTEGKRRRGWQRMRLLDSITYSMNTNLSKLQQIVKDRGAWRSEIHGVAKSSTGLSHWTTTTNTKKSLRKYTQTISQTTTYFTHCFPSKVPFVSIPLPRILVHTLLWSSEIRPHVCPSVCPSVLSCSPSPQRACSFLCRCLASSFPSAPWPSPSLLLYWPVPVCPIRPSHFQSSQKINHSLKSCSTTPVSPCFFNMRLGYPTDCQFLSDGDCILVILILPQGNIWLYNRIFYI